jgi:peptide/nickel transport system substrate-binding protein
MAPSDVARIEADENLTMLRQLNFTVNYIGFNTQHPPFDNRLVRQAINYAIDTDAIMSSILHNIGRPATGPIGAMVYGSISHELTGYPYNPDRARELLAEAGYADGFSTTFWFNIPNPVREDIAELVQAQLRNVNIDVDLVSMEFATYLERTSAGEHDMFILGWGTMTGDADYGLYALFHSSAFGAPGNRAFFDDPRVDDLLDRGRAETNPEQRLAIYAEVQRIISDEAPWLFVNQDETLMATNPRLRGFEINPAGQHWFWTSYFE